MSKKQMIYVGATSLLATLPVLGQASFWLANHARDLLEGHVVDAPVYDSAGSLLWGSQWRAELYGGATANSLSPAIDFYTHERVTVPFYAPGYFKGGGGYLSVFAVPPGSWAWLQVKVWDVHLGATYEEASARAVGGYGASALFYARGSYPGPGLPSASELLVGLESFSVLSVVPEPSTWGLLVLACGGIWWWRRKR